jgi:hypothetical protein
MMNRLISVLLGLTVWAALPVYADPVESDDFGIFDLLPWPWGTECPFPWKTIEGKWNSRTTVGREKFEFNSQGSLSNGTRLLEVARYDFEGRLVGVGMGVARRGDRIVRAAMVGVGEDDGSDYWAFIRTYSQKKTTCARKNQVTVVTLRSIKNHSFKDVHMVLDRDMKKGPTATIVE